MQLPFRYLLLPCAPLLFLWGHCTGLCRVASVNDAFICIVSDPWRCPSNVQKLLGVIWCHSTRPNFQSELVRPMLLIQCQWRFVPTQAPAWNLCPAEPCCHCPKSTSLASMDGPCSTYGGIWWKSQKFPLQTMGWSEAKCTTEVRNLSKSAVLWWTSTGLTIWLWLTVRHGKSPGF